MTDFKLETCNFETLLIAVIPAQAGIYFFIKELKYALGIGVSYRVARKARPETECRVTP